MSIEERLSDLRDLIEEAGLDAIAIVPGPNMRFLTEAAFHLSERPVIAFIPGSGAPQIVVPKLEAMKVDAMPFEARAFSYSDEEGPEKAVKMALLSLDNVIKGWPKPEWDDDTEDRDGDPSIWLGVEGRRARFLELDLMARATEPPRIFDADEIFAELRMAKDDTELAAMRHAVTIAETAIGQVLPMIKPGVTEREIASELVMALLRGGSETPFPFQPAVATGVSGASPHASSGERRVEAGDLIFIDWGATHQHYFSDITRTYAVAGADVHPDLLRAYEAVRAANEAGRNAVRPGATGEDVDAATRKVIEDAGFGQYFLHRTGHGLGLEIHEEPDMKAGNDTILEPGMTFTVEPGVYLPGLGGIRIEDDMVVTETGGESLTGLERGLVTLG